MPITIPIEDADVPPVTLSRLKYGAFSSVRVVSEDFAGGTGSLSVLSSTVAGGEGTGSIKPVKDDITNASASVRPVSVSRYPVFGTGEIVSGDSFLILADVLQETLSGPELGAFAYTHINGRLTVDGDVIPIKSFDYNVPSGKLGAILNVQLAVPNPALVPQGADVDFSLVVNNDGTDYYISLMNNGKLQQREYTITYKGGNNGGPVDQVSFSSLDVISDKFGLAPRRSVVMFDPRRVRYDSVQTRNDQMVRAENGQAIVPVIEPVIGLSMRTIIRRAYTGAGGFGFINSNGGGYGWAGLLSGSGADQQGCGFTSVITNIPDYKVRRADFTLEAGWHDGALPTVAMFSPQFFVRDNILFIIDVDRPLPAGITSKPVLLSQHKSLTEQVEYRPDANAVLLTYQYDGNDPNEDPAKLYRDVFKDEVVSETGTAGTAGYVKITVRRWDREVYMSDAPTQVLDSFPLRSDTETLQTVVWYDTDGTILAAYDRITHRESVSYQYEGDLKVGHTRSVFASVADPGAGYLVSLVEIEREVTQITWKEDPNNVGVKLQDRVITDIQGLCAYDPDTTETITDENGESIFVRMIPILLAQASGIIADNWLLSGLIPTKAIRMTLINTKGNQYDVEMVETDLLNNTVRRSFVEPTTGSVGNDPYESKSRTILLRNTASEAEIGTRIPVSVNAYELPRKKALELGRRVLRRLEDPLMKMPLVFAGVDLSITQGSVVRGQKRSGYTANYFITGYTIAGSNLGQRGHRITQRCDGIEILDND